jgi:hypothetical protein
MTQLRLTHALPARKSMVFEGLLHGAYGIFLLDSGATTSFMSLSFCAKHGIRMIDAPAAGTMADGTALSIPGLVRKAPVKLSGFKFQSDFLVADIPGIDAVLGMDFLARFNPVVSWRKRSMTVQHKGQSLCLHAHCEPTVAPSASPLIELCTIQAFANELRTAESNPEVFAAVVQPVQDTTESRGKGADHPDIAPLLARFTEVLRSELPPGLPPERLAADGTPIEHTIETAPDEQPTRAKPLPFTQEEHAEIRRQLDHLLASGWITPSLSPWASPVLFVRKKPDPITGVRGFRMCVSYVKLNQKNLNRIAYRLPRIADLLDKLGGAQYFSKLDLVSGYHQVRMRTSDVSKTAFCTPYGNFEFKVMPFGLRGAPSTFSYLMDQVFAEATTLSSDQRVLFLHFVAIYLDDVCIYSRTIEEHLCHLRAVLERLRKWKLYVKPSKCEWMQRSVEFLGHTVSGNGREVTHGKAAALQNWPEPQSVSDVRRLLGTFGFWRQYIPKYAEITAPLVALTAKAVAWHFDFAERASLAHLKRALLMAPVLIHPDSSKPFYVSTDASDFAIGASLEQKDPLDQLRPVAFFSHRLSNAERAYPVHERELLAIVLALRVWRHLLYGSEFEVVCQTDHRPLQHFLAQANLSGRQVRWQLFLSEYNLQVAYVPGAVNTFADGLSRRPDLRLMFIGAVAPYDSWLSHILTAYSQDPIASKLLKTATNFKQNATYRKAHGVLYYVDYLKFTLAVHKPL